LLAELEETHSQTKLSITATRLGVARIAERMETASEFTQRILLHGNGVEVVCHCD